jgi:hypothetical protein
MAEMRRIGHDSLDACGYVGAMNVCSANVGGDNIVGPDEISGARGWEIVVRDSKDAHSGVGCRGVLSGTIGRKLFQ